MRDVLRWPAKETAAVLEASVASVNSALQRARQTLRKHLPEPARTSPRDGAGPERTALERYMTAIERADGDALARLLSPDALACRQAGAGGHAGPEPALDQGRDAIIATWAPARDGTDALEFGFLPARANRQPAAAAYARVRGREEEFQPFALSVLRIEDGTVLDVSTFPPDLFPAFDLPVAL
jgi:RNA polymerase sigma-70 factor (ECF subfamily)